MTLEYLLPRLVPNGGKKKILDGLSVHWKAELVIEEGRGSGKEAHCKMRGIGLQQAMVGELLEALRSKGTLNVQISIVSGFDDHTSRHSVCFLSITKHHMQEFASFSSLQS